MCKECHQHVCPGGCPNADDEVIATCSECGRAIFAGEFYYHVNGDDYCDDCIGEMRVS
jgi:hypothetical protein